MKTTPISQERRSEPLLIDDIREIHYKLDNGNFPNYICIYLKCFIAIAFNGFCRVTEVCTLKFGDIMCFKDKDKDCLKITLNNRINQLQHTLWIKDYCDENEIQAVRLFNELIVVYKSLSIPIAKDKFIFNNFNSNSVLFR